MCIMAPPVTTCSPIKDLKKSSFYTNVHICYVQRVIVLEIPDFILGFLLQACTMKIMQSQKATSML